MKLTFLLLFGMLLSCSPNDKKVATEINAIMQTQEGAWNQGDIEAFMEPYLHNDSLVFIGSKGLNFGWQKVLDNYKSSYPTPIEMGNLKFKNKLFRPLGNQHFWVAGAWTLYREKDTLSGHYTLVWERKNNTWVIISDHSS